MKTLVTPARLLVMPAKAGIQFVLVLLLAGCFGSAPPVPDDVYYRLQLPAPAKIFDAPRVGVIVVDRPGAATVYTSRDLAYSDKPPHLHLSHYHYHHWVDPPPQLLQQALVDTLRAANIARTVMTEAGRQAPAWRISGVVRRFERQQSGSGWQASVALELRAESADRNQAPLLRQYETVVAADGDGIEDSVKAFSKATGTLFDRFLADFNGALAK